MLLSAQIAAVVVVLAYIVLYIRSRLHRGRNVTAATDEEDPAPVTPKANPVDLPTFPFEKAGVPIQGSELAYFQPFGPSDTITDVWCKLQTLVSTEPIVVRLSSAAAPPLFKSAFTPDGVVHSTGPMFLEDFARSILRYGWPAISRQVRALSSFGVPAEVPEGKYHFYTGPLVIELKGAQLSQVPFTVRAAFGPNLSLIPKHFMSGTEYLHCPVPSGENGGGMIVGFPWMLTHLALYSDDPSIASTVPEFVSDLRTKYDRLTRPNGSPADTVISDGTVSIRISEGTINGPTEHSIQVSYAPVPGGPLDDFSTADEEFVEFAKAITKGRVRLPISQAPPPAVSVP